MSAWRLKDGSPHGSIDAYGPLWPYPPMDNLGTLTDAEAEAVLVAKAEILGIGEKSGEGPVDSPRRAGVPAIAEIASLCELEGTPLASPGQLARHLGRRPRTCVECGSPVYGEHCTHCFES